MVGKNDYYNLAKSDTETLIKRRMMESTFFGLLESICVRPSKLANAKRSVIIYVIFFLDDGNCAFLQ